MSRAGVVLTWPDLGIFDPPPRILRDGRGYERRPVCPLCRAYSYRNTKRTNWRNHSPTPELSYQHEPKLAWCHCDRCSVRWRMVVGTYSSACYWGGRGPDGFWEGLLKTGSWSSEDHYMAWYREQQNAH